MLGIGRRQFITLLGGTVATPLLPARAQQAATPVIGFLDARLPETMGDRLRGFRQGLLENGYVEGDNVTVLYRWGENKLDRLPELAAELVGRRVSVIIGSGGLPAILAAKAATATIPVVFIVSEDPVRLGLVKSLARPEGNLTGVNFYNSELVAKQLELLRELVPQVVAVAALVNPANLNTSEATLRDIEPAARAMGLQIKLLRASTSREIDAAFAALALERADALFVGNDAFFNSRRVQLVQLAAHHRLPALYSGREYSDIGGLISYGTNIGDAYRQVGLYAGRVVKGAKPSDLPVLQSSTFELVINHQTARTLGLTVPDKLLVAADEVIE
jgi:putative ABC transport system substrate-binding protein